MPTVNDQSLTGGLGYEVADTPRPEYPPSYCPGATNLSQASKLVVRSGDEVQIGFGLRRGDMYAVSGRVLDASDHPLQGANVFVSPDYHAAEFSSPRYSGETDSSGRFQITGVAPFTAVPPRAVDKLYWSYTRDCGRMPTLQVVEISEAT